MCRKLAIIFIFVLSSKVVAETLVVQLMHQNKTPGQYISFNIYGMNGNPFNIVETTNQSGISRIELPSASYKIRVNNRVENIMVFPNQQNYKVIIIP